MAEHLKGDTPLKRLRYQIRLHEAAPAMLDALRDAQAVIGEFQYKCDVSKVNIFTLNNANDKIRAAIAAATGEEKAE